MRMVVLGVRNLGRSKLRLGVGALLIGVPVFLLLAFQAMGTAVRAQTDILRQGVDTHLQLRGKGSMGHVNMLGSSRLLPHDALEKVRAIEHVAKVEPYLLAMNPTLQIDGTGMVAVVGPSGSGKSTLLHLIGAMDRPTRGEVVVGGQRLNVLPPSALTRVRRQTVGFVFQTFNLIPNLSALENVTLPMEFNGVGKAERQARARGLLDQVGLGHRLRHRPGELSGGEQQRVAIARALANDPLVVLADEPTGNLDTETGRTIYELLQAVARRRTVLVVTHAEALAQLADRVIHIKDGRLEESR